MTTEQYLNDLVNQKNNLVDNLVSKGVTASKDEKLNTLVPKVLDIQSGGSTDEELINSFISSIDNSLGENLTKIPDGVTSIRPYAFYKCEKIPELIFNGDITFIGSRAFYFCTGVTKFVFPNVTSVPILDSTDAFQFTGVDAEGVYIYVPDNLVDSFKTDTTWSTYANQIKGISELT